MRSLLCDNAQGKEEWSPVPGAAKRLRWQEKTGFANKGIVGDLERPISEGKEEVFLGHLFASTSYLALLSASPRVPAA